MVVEPGKAFIMGGTYRIPILTGLLPKTFVNDLKRDSTFNQESFEREYGSKWTGTVEGAFFDGDKSAVRSWQNTLNDLYNTNINVDGISGSEFINNYNAINIPDKLQFYNTYLKYRLPTVRDKNRKGISNRTKRYR